jgi:hypothetical protein
MNRPTLAQIETELENFRYESSRFGYGLRQLPAHVRGPLALSIDNWLRTHNPLVVTIAAFTWRCPVCDASTRRKIASLEDLREDGWAQCLSCETKFELDQIELVAEVKL